MLALARAKVGERATLIEAYMRELPMLGEFDLVWAVNDAINYLIATEDLEAALVGMCRNLAPDGIVVFDVNTLATYRRFFAEQVVVERDGRRLVWRGPATSDKVPGSIRRLVWRGPATSDKVPGSIFEATFPGEGRGVVDHLHRQRHFPREEVLAAIKAAGLRCVSLLGESDGELESGLDEDRHTKAVYVCCEGTGGGGSRGGRVPAIPAALRRAIPFTDWI